MATLVLQALRILEVRGQLPNNAIPMADTTTDTCSSDAGINECGGAFPEPADESVLMYTVMQSDRDLTAWPAPANGLCFAGVGYPS